MIGAGGHEIEDTPGSSLEHVGWGGNLRAMRMHSEEASHLDHPPFRPALLSEPGTRSKRVPCSNPLHFLALEYTVESRNV